MTHANPTRPHTSAAAGGAVRRRALAEPARRRQASDFSDAVIAAYIHDISTRSALPRRPAPAGESAG